MRPGTRAMLRMPSVQSSTSYYPSCDVGLAELYVDKDNTGLALIPFH